MGKYSLASPQENSGAFLSLVLVEESAIMEISIGVWSFGNSFKRNHKNSLFVLSDDHYPNVSFPAPIAGGPRVRLLSIH